MSTLNGTERRKDAPAARPTTEPERLPTAATVDPAPFGPDDGEQWSAYVASRLQQFAAR